MFSRLAETPLIWVLKFFQLQQMKKGDGEQPGDPTKRGQHGKHQGCVWAKFTVLEEVPENLRVGVFAKPHSFDTVIRFSNGSSEDDTEDDAHGMAIKLLAVTGTKILAEEANAETQDFILADSPVFFAPNVWQLLKFGIAKKRGKSSEELGRMLPAIRGFKCAGKESPLVSDYWSQTPYKLGSQVVRYSAKHHEANHVSGTDQASKDFLKTAMKKRLDLGQPEARFDFLVQPAPQPQKDHIEDPTKPWDETTSPPVKVAEITIPAQDFDRDDQNELCENLSYTPWHSLPEHEPLGQINRARRVVYRASSLLRHEQRNTPRKEPTIADRPAGLGD